MIEDFGFSKVYRTKFTGDLQKLQKSVIPKLEKKFFQEQIPAENSLIKNGYMSFIPNQMFEENNKKDLKKWIDFYDFLVFLRPHLEVFAKDLTIPVHQIEILSVWANKYPHGAYIRDHAHIIYKNTYSFVFYIKKPINSGNLFIKDKNDKSYELISTEGDVLLFPSEITHYTSPNKNQEIKYVIAGDVSFGQKELDPTLEQMVKKFKEDYYRENK